jgi:imidazole glycerol-phosphate synthase subunit HisH
MSARRPVVAVVDYRLGNLFSVAQALSRADLDARITGERREIMVADAVVLPGVGAYPDAMAALKSLDLVGGLRDFARSGRPLLGVCLGQQLLMSESEEFGHTAGLGLIPGKVVRLDPGQREGGRAHKVPFVGWNAIRRAPGGGDWKSSPLGDLAEGVQVYFVHSFHTRPAAARHALAMTRYGSLEYCAAIMAGNVCGVQFHPERSGAEGLRIYSNFAAQVRQAKVPA